MSKKKEYLVPWEDGSVLHYADQRQHDWYRGEAEQDGFLPEWVSRVTWRHNEPFTARIRVTGTKRGRSAAYFMFEDTEHHTFPMFITDVATMLQGVNAEDGWINGRWDVARRGLNYGLRYLGPADD